MIKRWLVFSVLLLSLPVVFGMNYTWGFNITAWRLNYTAPVYNLSEALEVERESPPYGNVSINPRLFSRTNHYYSWADYLFNGSDYVYRYAGWLGFRVNTVTNKQFFSVDTYDFTSNRIKPRFGITTGYFMEDMYAGFSNLERVVFDVGEVRVKNDLRVDGLVVNQVVCVKEGKVLGVCSTNINSSGGCVCV